MKINELQEEFPWTPQIERSGGVHLSDVIVSLGEELFNASKKGEVDDATRMQFEKGFLWEQALSAAFGNRLATRCGEFVQDGIACSPDGITADEEGNIVVEEYKCTAMSSNKTPDQIWRWRTQVAAYCYVLGAQTAVFRILYLCGDYRTFVPTYRVYRLEFSEQETLEVWEMIVAHARQKGWIA